MVKFLGHWISLDCNRIFTRDGEPHEPMREREVNTFLRNRRNKEGYIRYDRGVHCSDRITHGGLEDFRRNGDDLMGRLTQ